MVKQNPAPIFSYQSEEQLSMGNFSLILKETRELNEEDKLCILYLPNSLIFYKLTNSLCKA